MSSFWQLGSPRSSRSRRAPTSRPSGSSATCWRQPRTGRTTSSPSVFPGPIVDGKPIREPVNLGQGWIGFDMTAALGRPVQLVNDAAMQALGSYEDGRMLFLGLGTGLGTTLVFDRKTVVPLEAGHLPYRKGHTFEDYIGQRGLDRFGRKKWRRFVADVATRLRLAFVADYVVLGGGNSRLLKKLPPDARLGKNENAFRGGFRLWDDGAAANTSCESGRCG